MSKRGPSATTIKRRERVLQVFLSGASLTSSSSSLAAAVGATGPTVRKDIRALRQDGHDIIASPGVGGGYRLHRAKRALWAPGLNTTGD